MLEFLTQSTWADRIGWVLVHSLWQFALVALLAIVLQRALQRRSATTRYRALLAAMFVMVAVPVATWFSPWSADAPAVAAKFGPVEKPENVSPSQRVSVATRDDTMAMAAVPAASPVELAAKPQAEPQSFGARADWSGLLVVDREEACSTVVARDRAGLACRGLGGCVPPAVELVHGASAEDGGRFARWRRGA